MDLELVIAASFPRRGVRRLGLAVVGWFLEERGLFGLRLCRRNARERCYGGRS